MHAHVVFVGGGLANGLAAYRLTQTRPGIRIIVVESGARFGGNHTWSFHGSDLTFAQSQWIAPFVSKSWSRYAVHFPQYGRDLHSSYHSIRSEDFHARLFESLKGSVRLGRTAVELSAHRVVLDDGEVLTADCVIDGRGWCPSTPGRFAYQKFLGQTVQLEKPHGLPGPIVMDARVVQDDGYRFFYALPWTDRSVLLEDTHYSEEPGLDAETARREIGRYCAGRGWKILAVEYEEQGSLVIPLEGEVPHFSAGIACNGVRGGFFHATTGYSVPFAVSCAERIASTRKLDSETVSASLGRASASVWRRGAYSRLLNRLLFDACRPEDRYRILENFYRMPEGLIRRFYAGRMQPWDKIRLFLGRPPIPVGQALKTLLGRPQLARG